MTKPRFLTLSNMLNIHNSLLCIFNQIKTVSYQAFFNVRLILMQQRIRYIYLIVSSAYLMEEANNSRFTIIN